MTTDRLGDYIMSLYKYLKTNIERDLKEFDIGMGQLQILMIFFNDLTGTFTQSDLVNALDVDKGNVSRSVTKLLEKGYIEAFEAPQSGSVSNYKRYRLTTDGTSLKSKIVPKFIALNRAMTQEIDPEHLAITLSTLDKMSNNLEAQL